MDGEKRLVITLAVEVTVPPTGLDFNCLIAAFRQFGGLTVCRLFEATLKAWEHWVGSRLQEDEPGRYVWNGHQGREKRWVLPFGEVFHRYRRMVDRKVGMSFCPLRLALDIPERKRLTWPVMAGAVGLASELSFRRAAQEGRRFQQGLGPSKSSAWLYFQGFADAGLDPMVSAEQRTLEVVIADGTKLKRQDQGWSCDQMDLRIVLAQKRDGSGLQVAAFDLEASWPEIKKRLKEQFPEEKVGVLIHDGEEAIDALADPRTRIQRCLVHGPRGLSYALYQDGLKKPEQAPFLRRLHEIRAWRADSEAVAEMSDKTRYELGGLVDQAQWAVEEIVRLLPARAVHARAYLERYVRQSLTYVRALLNREPPLSDVTTNRAENVFSQMDLRLKRIGRRWSLSGALNMVRVLLAKILNLPHWRDHLAAFTAGPGSVRIDAQIFSTAWAS